MFAKVLECEGEIGGKELEQLSQELEKKKSKRNASFHQRSFGIENRMLESAEEKSGSELEKTKETKILEREKKISEEKMLEKEKEIEEKLMPKGFQKAWKLEQLGGSKDQSNFIAVVHIDGNSMGKRVENLYHSLEGMSWEEYRKALKTFSDSIDEHFKAAFQEMAEEIADLIRHGGLKELELVEDYFPIRRVITAGDDVCFITEGRIGLECARIFIEKLAQKKNKQDEQHYAACAGVAIVHQKYPFYRAYELAEELCSNAKKFIATTYKEIQDKKEKENRNRDGKEKGSVTSSTSRRILLKGNNEKEEESAITEEGTVTEKRMDSADVGANVCAIDWHIEYGEMKDELEEIRAMYQTIELDYGEDISKEEEQKESKEPNATACKVCKKEKESKEELWKKEEKLKEEVWEKEEGSKEELWEKEEGSKEELWGKEEEQKEKKWEPQRLELRPYILLDSKNLLEDEMIRKYSKFKKLMKTIQTGNIDYAKGKLKGLRQYLKKGETSAAYYIRTRQIGDLDLLGYQDIFVPVDYSKIGTGDQLERKTFVRTMDKKKRCLYFDAIELLDTFIPIEEQGEEHSEQPYNED